MTTRNDKLIAAHADALIIETESFIRSFTELLETKVDELIERLRTAPIDHVYAHGQYTFTFDRVSMKTAVREYDAWKTVCASMTTQAVTYDVIAETIRGDAKFIVTVTIQEAA